MEERKEEVRIGGIDVIFAIRDDDVAEAGQ